MKIFVTGAGGYVGSNLLRSLSGRHKIIACDVFQNNDVPEGVEWLSVTDRLEVGEWSKHMAGCDAIVHLAQSPFYRDFPDKAEALFDTNVQTTFHLFEAARQSGIATFVYFSSGGIYGDEKNVFHELDRLNPQNFYLATKGMCELVARKYRPYLDVHIVRPFFIYGPGQKDKLIVNLTERVADGDSVQINGGEGGGQINPIHVDDVVNLTERLIATRGNTTLNFAGPDVMSLLEMVMMMGELLGKEPVIQRNPDGQPLNLVADISRIRECFPDYELIPFRKGLETVNSGQ